MKSCFLVVGAIFMVALCVFKPCVAQELPQNCDGFCICVSDTSCTSLTGCDATGEGCTSLQFSVNSVSGCRLKLEELLACTGECEHCFACALVVDMAGHLVDGVQTGCAPGQGCTEVRIVNLPAGNYKLLACLRKCFTESCAQCSGCVARARLYDTIDDCPTACSW